MNKTIMLILLLTLASLACGLTTVPLPATMPKPALAPVPYEPDTFDSLRTAPKARSVTVTAIEAVHVRALPDPKSASLAILLHGEPVTVTGECQGTWAAVEWNGGVGWVNAEYISGDVCEQ